MLETLLAYLAGLIDGEGSITLYLRKGNSLVLRVVVYNTNEDVIDWLHLKFGGCKYRVGQRANPKHRPEYAWHIHSNYACDILKKVLLYLIVKQAKAKIAIEAWESRQPTPRGERLYPIPAEVLYNRQGYVEAFRQAN